VLPILISSSIYMMTTTALLVGVDIYADNCFISWPREMLLLLFSELLSYMSA
jgi:hypothetical protein